MKTVLVTRPDDLAESTIAALKGRGHTALHAPIMRVEKQSFEHPADEERHLIVTSRNGVKFGLEALAERHFFVHAVGEATAEAARAAGYMNVRAGPGTAKGLLPQLIDLGTQHGAQFSHLCGEELAFNIAHHLTEKDISAETITCYRMVPNIDLPEDVVSALTAGDIDVVLFHSARAARAFEELLVEKGSLDWVKSVQALCLSSRIHSELMGPWRKISHAIMPTEKTLLSLLGPKQETSA